MSIISKLKGAKKAADEHKAKTTTTTETDKPVSAPYKHVPTHAATDALTSSPTGFKAHDLEQIKLVNQARLSRIGSDYSARTATSSLSTTRPATAHATSSRPPRPGFNRALSDSSIDFTPPTFTQTLPARPRSSSASHRSHSRTSSFQSLERVVEDNDVDTEPVFAAALLMSRSKNSRSPRGSARSSLGKSPLSSVESSADSSPVHSEANSEASGSSSGSLELRGQRATYPPVHDIHPGQKVGDMFSQPERKYFVHKAQLCYTSLAKEETVPVPVQPPAVKKDRFSFMKRNSGSGAVAAH